MWNRGRKSTATCKERVVARGSRNRHARKGCMALVDLVALADRPMRLHRHTLSRTDQPRGTLHRQLTPSGGGGAAEVNAEHNHAPGLRLFKPRLDDAGSARNSGSPSPTRRRCTALTGETMHLGMLKESRDHLSRQGREPPGRYAWTPRSGNAPRRPIAPASARRR